MTHKGIGEPHVLHAASNPHKMIRNVSGIIGPVATKLIEDEITRNVGLLFALGTAHHAFAVSLRRADWRQRISRLYYAAYNTKRAISLHYDGSFSTDSKDHEQIDRLPGGMDNEHTYKAKLKILRDDRNLADYSHLAHETDLLITPDDAQTLVTEFISDSRKFLMDRGILV